MTNTGKTVTTIAAAAALGAGVFMTQLSTDSPDASENASQVIDDIQPIAVQVYSVPTVDIGTVSVEVSQITSNSEGVAGDTITSHQVATYIGGVIGIESPGVEVAATGVVTVATHEVGSIGGDILENQAMQRDLAEKVRDQRMLQYDSTLTPYNEAARAWVAIYNRPLPPPADYVPLPDGLRMIAELRSTDHAAENLAYYQQQGYNACLIAVYGTETVSELMAKVNLVRSSGMAVWLAWSGPERLEWSIFQDPSRIANLLKTAAPFCQGYLVAWRRTSAHLVEQDAHYLEHLVHQVRTANPKICIVGESYWGQTWENQPYVKQRGWEARDNVARGQSGVMIAGISTMRHSIERMLSVEFSKWKDTPRLGLVLGERAYYASSKDTRRSFEANLRIKRQLENRFLRAGCVGTITIHGDGSDRGVTLQSVDDLGRYRIE